jgi:hypothetical protein
MIKISSNFKGKKYFHNDEEVYFRRVWGGISWPGEKAGTVVVLGEKNSFGKAHRYVLAEARSGSPAELIVAANKLTENLEVGEWFGRHVEGSKEFLNQKNSQAFSSRKRELYITDAPGPIDNTISYHINTIHDCLQPKTLHFFQDSSLPADLKKLPDIVYGLTNIEYPATAALGYVLAALVENPPYVSSNITIKQKYY